jgi:hypothetical protein
LMYGTRDRIFFISGSARFHRHGEQWHWSLLNEPNVIVAEGAE